VIVTGREIARTSERARGATILIRLSLFLVLIIGLYPWLSGASPA
jgi:hypothetical protein